MSKNKADEIRSLETAEAAREVEWQQPSFVGDLFMGRLQTELVFPFPHQNEEDRNEAEELLAELKVFLADRTEPMSGGNL